MTASISHFPARRMTRADLPPADTRRWVTRRKAEVVAGVRQGLITLAEACERYGLTVDEFMSWQKRLESHGVDGLRATRVVELRREDRSFTGEWAANGAA
ncbi:MAG: CtrA inhibitor SciP [Rhodospirillales bacterium]